jgi:hypothetical protein
MIYHIGIGNTINHFRTPEPPADDIVLKKKPKARLPDPRYLAKFAGKHVRVMGNQRWHKGDRDPVIVAERVERVW